jgi:uncharacterized paraquat-inducible protein A
MEDKKQCQHCKEPINKDATICPHCQQSIYLSPTDKKYSELCFGCAGIIFLILILYWLFKVLFHN